MWLVGLNRAENWQQTSEFGMRSISATVSRLSNPPTRESSEGEENDVPLQLAPLMVDENGDGFLSSSHPRWEQEHGDRNIPLSKQKLEEKHPFEDEETETIEDSSAQKALLTGEGKRIWLNLSWAVSWIIMLSKELNGSFVFGVVVVYGFGQGFGGSINSVVGVVVDYYWKDVQGAQPSAVQLYRGFSGIAWDVKPLWGLMTDILPIAGYRRRPYFLITGLLTIVGTMVLVMGGKLWVPVAFGMLTLVETCAAISDAAIDAEAAQKSRERPNLAADIQSLCAICLAVGSLIGFAVSGISVDWLGSEAALSLMLIPAVLLVTLGFVLHEERDPKKYHYSHFGQQLWTVTEQLWATLKQSQIWKTTLYMYLSFAFNPDISEGKFYWYTTARNGPHFSEEFVGAIYATGSIGTIGAVYLYHKKLKRVSFRWILFWVQVLVAVFGMLDFVLVTRFNLQLHIPDGVFVVGDESMTHALSRLKWMPILILAAKLCPPGIEGTFFAFLMSVDNVGMLTSSWLGAGLLSLTKVTKENFEHLWLAVMIRNVLRLVPVFLVFLLPNTDPEEDIMETTKPEENLQLVMISTQKEASHGTQTMS